MLALAPDPALREHLRALQRADDPFVWPERDEAPVAAAVVGVLGRLELLSAPASAAA